MTIDELESLIWSLAEASVGAGASDTTIQKAQQSLGISFPASLTQYLQRLGWVRVRHLEFYGLGVDVPDHLELVATTLWEREAGSPLPSRLLPIQNDGAGNLYCVDVLGEVVFWDHESGPEQVPERVAKNLVDFLAEQVMSMQPPQPPHDVDDLRVFLYATAVPTPPERELATIVKKYFDGDVEARRNLAGSVLALLSADPPDRDMKVVLHEQYGYAFVPPVQTTARQWLTSLAAELLS